MERKAVCVLICLICTALAPSGFTSEPPPAFAPEKAAFTVTFGGTEIPYRLMAVFVLPGESVEITAAGGEEDSVYLLQPSSGLLSRGNCRRWVWTAPEKAGLYPMTIQRPEDGASVALNVFVMVPVEEVRRGSLNGYGIGEYPKKLHRGFAIYKPPEGFVEVTEENIDTPVSPHFTLRQFLCKQDGGYPKYLVLRPQLLVKLELILEEVNERGWRCSTLFVMCGFRTPKYNKSIGNGKYSRHCWGDAADIYVDGGPKDNRMDDLDGNGKVDVKDARALADLVERMEKGPEGANLIGGLGIYGPKGSRSPFVHVDVRGYRARW